MIARRILLASLLVAAVISIAAPFVVAMPLLQQTPALLAFARTAGAAAPALSLAAAAAFAVWCWRTRSRSSWALLSIALLCVWLARVNLFEWIFAPASGAVFLAAHDFHDIRDSDMVIGVTLGGESRAYPVRYLAYHRALQNRVTGCTQADGQEL